MIEGVKRSKRVAAAVLLLPILVASGGAASAATYHVAPSGNDSAAGTAAAPWRTLQKATSSFAPSDIVIVHAGTYTGEMKVSRNGPVTFRAQGGPVTIDGRERITGFQLSSCAGSNDCFSTEYTGSGQVLWVDGVRCDVIDWGEVSAGCGSPSAPHKCIDTPGQCWVDTSGNRAWVKLPPGSGPAEHEILVPSARHGIFIQEADDITIDGINVIGTVNHGFQAFGPLSGAVYRNATVTQTGYRNRNSTGFAGRGVNVSGSGNDTSFHATNVLVQNVTAVDVGRSGFTWGNGVTDSVFDGCIARDNRYHNGFDILSSADMVAPRNARNVIRNSASYRNGLGILLQGCRECVVANNDIHDNAGGGILMQKTPGGRAGNDNRVQQNLIYAHSTTAANGVTLVDERDVELYNNTIHGSGAQGLAVSGNTNVDARNNIFAGNSLRALKIYGDAGDKSQTFDYNVYSGTSGGRLAVWEGGDCERCSFTSLAEFRTRRGAEVNGFEAFPEFTDLNSHQFSLRESSPAVDAGVDVGIPFSGPAPDIGAIELIHASGAPDLLRVTPGFDD